MATEEKKGITVKIDAKLHAEVRAYLDDHNMTMAEFVAQALEDELHPKNQMKEGATMANTRTIAVQVPEELFQRIKEYLLRNNMTQRQFVIGLIEDELDREMSEREAAVEAVSDEESLADSETEQEDGASVSDSEGDSEEIDADDLDQEEDEGLSMSM